jgi:hypothetical protein
VNSHMIEDTANETHETNAHGRGRTMKSPQERRYRARLERLRQWRQLSRLMSPATRREKAKRLRLNRRLECQRRKGELQWMCDF